MKEKLLTLLTAIEGVKLQVRSDFKEKVNPKLIKDFYRLAKSFFGVRSKLEKILVQQEKLRSKIIELVKSQEGLRGILSEKDNFALTIFPRQKISWNRELLKNSLGSIYPTVVSEELVINISIPIGKMSEKGMEISEESIKNSVVNSLISLGISSEDLKKMMYAQVEISVNEKRLEKLIKQERIVLLPGAQEKTIYWVINVKPLNTHN